MQYVRETTFRAKVQARGPNFSLEVPVERFRTLRKTGGTQGRVL